MKDGGWAISSQEAKDKNSSVCFAYTAKDSKSSVSPTYSSEWKVKTKVGKHGVDWKVHTFAVVWQAFENGQPVFLPEAGVYGTVRGVGRKKDTVLVELDQAGG